VSSWTDEEILALIRPTQSTMQIANTLHRSHSAIRRKTAELCSEGLLKSKKRGIELPQPSHCAVCMLRPSGHRIGSPSQVFTLPPLLHASAKLELSTSARSITAGPTPRS
jgi:hypothetical protein